MALAGVAIGAEALQERPAVAAHKSVVCRPQAIATVARRDCRLTCTISVKGGERARASRRSSRVGLTLRVRAQMYHFLCIGKTVDLLSGAAQRTRPLTRALENSSNTITGTIKLNATPAGASAAAPGVTEAAHVRGGGAAPDAVTEEPLLADENALRSALENLEGRFHHRSCTRVLRLAHTRACRLVY